MARRRDDYVVRFEGHSIGRVRLDGTNWVWSITIPMALPEWAEGTAASRDEGLKTLARRLGQVTGADQRRTPAAGMGSGKGF